MKTQFAILAILLTAFTASASERPSLYRLYNPNNYEHLFTSDLTEYNQLHALGWNQEGTICRMFTDADIVDLGKSNEIEDGSFASPLLRVYNTESGTHFFSFNSAAIDAFVLGGWLRETSPGRIITAQRGFNTYKSIYRMSQKGHSRTFLTSSMHEIDIIKKFGWDSEFYGRAPLDN